jgi:glycosyltransferase involved in cell wall biosynthesis
MPDIIKTDPSVLYIILGATHPEVIKHEGQSYKNELLALVDELGIRYNVLFHNHFVSDRQLHKFLAAADIYVTPYLYREQLTSGTLAFAVGSGKAVVSTPYWAAQELLADGRGKLVRFRDSKHLGQTICGIINDNVLFNQLRLNAYNYGRAMAWPRIGLKYSTLIRNFLTKAPVKYWDVVSSAKTVIKSKTKFYQSV